MKTKQIFIGFLILGLGVFFWQQNSLVKSSWEIKNLPPKGRKVLFIGDGLLTRLEINNFLAAEKSKNKLELIAENEIYSLASQAKARITQLLLRHQPDLVIVSLGMEDLRRSTDWGLFFEDLEAVLSKIVRSGAVAVLIGSKAPWQPDNFVFGVENICKKNGVFLISDYLEGFWQQDLDQTLVSLNREQKNVLAKRLYLVLSSFYK